MLISDRAASPFWHTAIATRQRSSFDGANTSRRTTGVAVQTSVYSASGASIIFLDQEVHRTNVVPHLPRRPVDSDRDAAAVRRRARRGPRTGSGSAFERPAQREARARLRSRRGRGCIGIDVVRRRRRTVSRQRGLGRPLLGPASAPRSAWGAARLLRSGRCPRQG